jgi:hypothetical protein
LAKSSYDELHDEYLDDGGGKAGTRYERLMGLVLAVLNRNASIVHDIRLRGDTGVAHQIDVRLTRKDGENQHILVECKDFDKSGDSVGLSIVRDFWGVVDDVKPNDAWVVTCTDFTRDAQIYARGKGIKLAILRLFRDDDWNGRIQTVEITGQLLIPTDFKSTILFKAEDESRLAAAQALANTSSTYESPIAVILKDGTRQQINKYMENKLKAGPAKEVSNDRREVDALESGLLIQYGDAEPLEPESLSVSYCLREDPPMTITVSIADQLARLLLMPIGEGTDYVILDKELREFSIDRETGEVQQKQQNVRI